MGIELDTEIWDEYDLRTNTAKSKSTNELSGQLGVGTLMIVDLHRTGSVSSGRNLVPVEIQRH